MKNKLKKISIICAVLLAGTVAFLSVATFEIPTLGSRIESELESRTGLDLKFERISLKLLPRPAVRISKVTVYKNEELLFKAARLEARLSLSTLTGGAVAFKDITLEGAGLNVALKADKSPSAPGPAASWTSILQKIPSIGNLIIKNSILRLEGIPAPSAKPAVRKQAIIEISLAYLNETSGRVFYGLEGNVKNGPIISITGEATDKFKSISGIASINNLTTDLISGFAPNSCGCAGLNGKIGAELSYTLNDSGMEIKADKVTLKTPEFAIKARGHYKDTGSDPILMLSLSSGAIPISSIIKTIPYELLSYQTAKHIRKLNVSAGDIRIDSAVLNGTLAELKSGAIYKKPGAIALKASISGAVLAYEGFDTTVSGLSGKISYKDNLFAIKDFSARIGAGKIEALNIEIKDPAARLSYIASVNASFNAYDALNIARIATRSNRLMLGLLNELNAAGQIDLSASARGIATKIPQAFSGRVALKNANFSHIGTGLKADAISGYADFTEQKITIGKLKITHGASHLELDGEVSDYTAPEPSYEASISGSIENESLNMLSKSASPTLRSFVAPIKLGARVKKRGGSFTLYASIDTGSKQNYGTALPEDNSDDDTTDNAASETDANPGRSIELHGTELLIKREANAGNTDTPALGSLKIKSGNLKGHMLRDLSATLRIDDEKIDAAPIVTMIDGGSLSAELSYFRKESSPDLLKLNATITDARFEDIIAAAGARKKVLVGPVSGRVKLTARRVKEKFPRGLDGRVELASENGSLRKFIVLNKMFAIVNIISITELFEKGFPYKKLAGDFTFKNGIIHTDNLFFDGSSMRMSASGSLDPALATIDCTFGMHPFVTFDKIVSVVPIANWLILDKDGTSASMYYELTGALRDMSIAPVMKRSDRDSTPIGLKKTDGAGAGTLPTDYESKKNSTAR